MIILLLILIKYKTVIAERLLTMSFFKKRQIIINILFIILPLIFGLIIYILSDRDVFISKLIFNLIPFSFSSLNIRHPVFLFFRNHMCDFFWAVSLESCIGLILLNCKKQFLISIIISVVLSVLLELFQLFGIISGTFDIFDLLFETIAIIMAGLILNKSIWRSNK